MSKIKVLYVMGTHEEKLAEVRKIRDLIRDQIQALCLEICPAAKAEGEFAEAV